jgi:hypothetical protein
MVYYADLYTVVFIMTSVNQHIYIYIYIVYCYCLLYQNNLCCVKTKNIVTKIFVHFYIDFTSRFLKQIWLFPYPMDFVILYGSMEWNKCKWFRRGGGRMRRAALNRSVRHARQTQWTTAHDSKGELFWVSQHLLLMDYSDITVEHQERPVYKHAIFLPSHMR